MPTVWIANRSGHNYVDAERYGEVKELTAGTVKWANIDRMAYDLAHLITKQVNWEEDYLLISGAITVNILAVMIWLQHTDKVRILLWVGTPETRSYVMRTIDRNQIINLVDEALTG